jgi:hypothetical protein
LAWQIIKEPGPWKILNSQVADLLSQPGGDKRLHFVGEDSSHKKGEEHRDFEETCAPQAQKEESISSRSYSLKRYQCGNLLKLGLPSLTRAPGSGLKSWIVGKADHARSIT